MRKIFIGLDLGASAICAAAAAVEKTGAVNIIATERLVTDAVRDGAVTNADKAIKDIRLIMESLGKKTGKKIKYVHAGINDRTIKGEISRGMIPLAQRGRVVTGRDMDKCVKVANVFNLPLDRELVHNIPRRFFIDDRIPVDNPKGLYASKLSVEIYVITVNISSVRNINNCVDKAGFILRGIAFSTLGASLSVLEEREKSEGALLIDVGRKTSRMLLFLGGMLEAISVLPSGNEDNAFLENVKKEYAKRYENKVRGIVVTGEGAFSEGLIEGVEKVLKLPAKIGIASDVNGKLHGAERSLQAPCLGIIEYFVNEFKGRKQPGLASRRPFKKVWDLLDSYF